jgi:hypothetical protein
MKFSFPRPRRAILKTYPPDVIVGESIYLFLLSDEAVGFLLALGIVAAQALVLATFGLSSWSDVMGPGNSRRPTRPLGSSCYSCTWAAR